MSVIERHDSGVALKQLEGGLASLWQRLQVEEGVALSHALTANVIAVTDWATEAEVRSELDRLVVRHRCRVFFVVRDEDDGPMRVALTTRGKRGGNRDCQGVLEQIDLRCGPRDCLHVPGLVRSNLVVDVPAHLYWATKIPDDHWQLSTMVRVADHRIVASRRLANPGRDFTRLSEIAPGEWTDIAGFRARPWRRALAEAFEHFAWRAETGTDVDIRHGSEAAAAATAHSLARWLGQRLRARAQVTRERDETAPEHEPAMLSLAHGPIRIEMSRDATHVRAEISRDGAPIDTISVIASRGSDGDLLAAAIDAY